MNMLKKGLLIAFITLLIDQLSKWYFVDVFLIADKSPVYVLPFFNLVMVWNKGISFGMFHNTSYGMYLFSVIAIIISSGLVYWLTKVKSNIQSIPIGLIIGGAIGNVIDRFLRGAVADFFDFHIFGFHWPAFNIADSAVFIGALLLCIDSIIHSNNDAPVIRKKKRRKAHG